MSRLGLVGWVSHLGYRQYAGLVLAGSEWWLRYLYSAQHGPLALCQSGPGPLAHWGAELQEEKLGWRNQSQHPQH